MLALGNISKIERTGMSQNIKFGHGHPSGHLSNLRNTKAKSPKAHSNSSYTTTRQTTNDKRQTTNDKRQMQYLAL